MTKMSSEISQNFQRIREFVTYVRKINVRGYDMPICISGPEQSGKSTLAIQLVKLLQGNIDFTKNIGYNLNECLEEIPKLPNHSCYILDEAIRAMYKRDWARPENKELNKVFAQIGMKKCIFFFNIPNFQDLDRFYREHRVRLWINIIGNDWNIATNKPDKFYATVYSKDLCPFSDDPWFLRTAFKTHKKRIEKSTDLPIYIHTKAKFALGVAKYNPCLIHSFSYPPLDDDEWNQYFKLSSERKMLRDNTVSYNETINKKWVQFVHALHNQGKSIREISSLSALPGMTKPMLSKSKVHRLLSVPCPVSHD